MSAVVFRAASAAVIVLAGVGIWGLVAIGRDGHAHPELRSQQDPKQLVSEGQRVFRFETFGDEEFWTDKARMHEVVRQSVSPTMALKVGLKVDAEAIPADVAAAIKSGKVDLESPADDRNAPQAQRGSRAQGHGRDSRRERQSRSARDYLCPLPFDRRRLVLEGHRAPPGWMAQPRSQRRSHHRALSRHHAGAEGGLQLMGAGKYDPRYNLDGKSNPLVLPPAYGLAKVKNETYTAEGPISYWNAYVAVTQMHGQGNFSDPRLMIEVKNTPDVVTPMLPALAAYQHSLPAPAPPAGTFDVAAAGRGRLVFDRSCLGCHVDTNNTDNNAGALHQPSETGMDGAYAARTANKAYRTTPLRGLSQHPPYFHDGSAATLDAVVDHYDRVRQTLADRRAEKRPRPVPEVALRKEVMNRKLILLVGLIAGVGSLGACADRGSREAFRRDLQARLEQLDLKIGQLEDRTRQAKEDVRPQMDAVVKDLREKRQRAADKLREVENATDDSWQRFKGDATAAVDDLGETVERGWREIVK